MMDYSPMNNVQAGREYPACWITGGLHDPRVAYWEPAKFAATLRHANPDGENPVFLKVNMGAGHFSASDRYKHYRELASDYAFLLDQLGLAEGAGPRPVTTAAGCPWQRELGLGRRLLDLGLCWSRLSVRTLVGQELGSESKPLRRPLSMWPLAPRPPQ